MPILTNGALQDAALSRDTTLRESVELELCPSGAASSEQEDVTEFFLACLPGGEVSVLPSCWVSGTWDEVWSCVKSLWICCSLLSEAPASLRVERTRASGFGFRPGWPACRPLTAPEQAEPAGAGPDHGWGTGSGRGPQRGPALAAGCPAPGRIPPTEQSQVGKRVTLTHRG